MKFLFKFIAIVFLILLLLPVLVIGLISFVDLNPHKDLIAKYLGDSLGRQIEIKDGIDINLGLQPSLELKGLAIKNASWASEENMFEAAQLKAEVELLPLLSRKPQINLTNISYKDGHFFQSTNEAGVSNWSFGEAKKKSPTKDSDAPLALDLESASISNLTVKVDSPKAEPLKLKIDTFNLSPSKLKRTIHFRGSYQDVKLEIDGKVGGIAQLLGSDKYPIQLKSKINDASLDLSGDLLLSDPTKDTSLNFNLDLPSLSSFNSLVSSELPEMSQIQAQGQVKLTPNRVNLKLDKTQLGESDFSGTIALTPKPNPSPFEINLTSDNLNLADLQPKKVAKAETKEPTPKKDSDELFSKDQLPVDLLKSLKGVVKLSLKDLVLTDKLQVQKTELSFEANAGKLSVDKFHSELFEGLIDGKASYDLSGDASNLDFDLKAKDFNYGEILAKLLDQKSLKGKLQADIQLKSNGLSPHAIASNLNGDMKLHSQQGVLNNKFFKLVSGGIQDILAPLFKKDPTVKINCFISNFSIKDGEIDAEDQILDSQAITVLGDGKINLDKEEMKMNFLIKANQPGLSSLIPPFTISGPLSGPRVRPDALKSAVGVATTGISVASSGADMAGQVANVVRKGKMKKRRAGLARCQHALENKGKLWPSS